MGHPEKFYNLVNKIRKNSIIKAVNCMVIRTYQSSEYSADIPETIYDVSVTRIGRYAFSSCKKLKSVTIGDGVREIGYNVFVFCKNLEDIAFPDSVKSIAGFAFSNYEALQTVTFGSGLKHIDENAFYTCHALESFYFCGGALGATDKMINGKLNSVLKIYYLAEAPGLTSPAWNGYIPQKVYSHTFRGILFYWNFCRTYGSLNSKRSVPHNPRCRVAH